MKKAAPKLTPVRLKISLLVAMMALIALGVGGFYWAYTFLSGQADSVSQKVAEADASDNSVSELQQLEARLEELGGERERTRSIVAGSSSYQYQDQVISELNHYANQAGIRISQFGFDEVGGSGSSSSAEASSATPSPSPTGASTATVNLTLEQPIEYTNLMRFIKLIENNLTKMQLNGLSLSPGESSSRVSTNSLTIEVYIR